MKTEHLDVLDGQPRGEGLLQLVNLLRVSDGESVQVATASHLELGDVLGLLDLDGCVRGGSGDGGGESTWCRSSGSKGRAIWTRNEEGKQRDCMMMGQTCCGGTTNNY
eukprot:TRINITY_DN626_c0_g1_i1.p2 TRINITY_DN626_c0_g1~~TRINITY_DN626_c0_g1_i1.p2  ORF type:complete len:108 (+),score=6.12 TRINITY_DN626_c0_g1_i1:81-404(+)